MSRPLLVLLALLALTACATQPRIARTADGKPDLNGIWEAMGTAHWNLEPHNAQGGPIAQLGALGAIPGGLGIVERATYLPHPFQITQERSALLIAYEFAGATRIVYMNQPDLPAQVDSWMGHNLGRWEGDTLVIDVTAQVADTWLDSAGNFHGPAMQVQERYTPAGPDLLLYEATITDPEVFTRPWKISLPLYRRLDKNAQLLEFRCVEFAEELLYGKYRKRPVSP